LIKRPDLQAWRNFLLPLPREIGIAEWVDCRPGEVRVRVLEGAGELEAQAGAELRQLFVEKGGGGDADGVDADGAGFEILLGVPTDGSLAGIPIDMEPLHDRPNRDQAYLITAHGKDRLLLSALDGRGVYYAARTLYQLLEFTISPERVYLPLATVRDWPDVEERGLWNFPDVADWIPWMASIKLNYGKMADTRLATIERDRRNHAQIDAGLMREAARRAFNYLPFILHLNFLHECGLFQAYPELAGVGDGALCGRYFAHKQGNQHRVPCASQPKLVEILAEWMSAIAAQGAGEISCWLSERPGQCGCSGCTATGQFVMEARAFTAAWRRVQSQYPNLTIRLFLSTTSSQRDHQVVAEAPPEVKIERACAVWLERVLHQPRDLMANPLLDSGAAEGRWVASYDVPIGAFGRVDTPEFKLPARSAHRVRDYVSQLIRRRYRGAYGMLAWTSLARQINGFNVEALAEWSWNGDGRDEEAFATAWATRHGFADPERVGRWATLMGPIEFDVYDSDFPMCYSWGQAIEIVDRRQRPRLGEGMFRYYLDEPDFDRKKSVCVEALALVADEEHLDLANETQVVSSYVNLAHAIYRIAVLVATADPGPIQAQLLEGVEALELAGTENVAAIRAWRSGLGPEPWHYRVHDALNATDNTVAEIARMVRERHVLHGRDCSL
jgi:hypothetical protein